MKNKKTLGLIAGAAALAPGLALAQGISNLSDIVQYFSGFIAALLPFVIALGVLVFVFGVFQYIGAGDDPEKQKSGRSKMIYGVVAIFVMVSVWGLVNILVNSFGLGTTAVSAPTFVAPPTFHS